MSSSRASGCALSRRGEERSEVLAQSALADHLLGRIGGDLKVMSRIIVVVETPAHQRGARQDAVGRSLVDRPRSEAVHSGRIAAASSNSLSTKSRIVTFDVR